MKKREMAAIFESMKEFNVSSAEIVTHYSEDHPEESGKSVSIVPFWKWALL